MRETVPVVTPLEWAALIALIVCMATGVGITIYCTQQLRKKPSLYMAWLLMATILLLVSQILLAFRAYASFAFPPVAGIISVPFSLCSLAFVCGEIEFALFGANTLNVMQLRIKIYAAVGLLFSGCWGMRFVSEYGLVKLSPPLEALNGLLILIWLVILDVIDISIQIRMALLIRRLFRAGDVAKQKYTFSSTGLIALLVIFDTTSLLMFVTTEAASAVSWRLAETWTVLNVSLLIMHIVLSICIMESGRFHLQQRGKHTAASVGSHSNSSRRAQSATVAQRLTIFTRWTKPPSSGVNAGYEMAAMTPQSTGFRYDDLPVGPPTSFATNQETTRTQ
ncbi:hypothetical protein BC831DRAFT_453415 [Entophlyctis helioformis]|nr:hypothetical protein BC831DRAFT_453415 [Entophlyctis helioformis]